VPGRHHRRSYPDHDGLGHPLAPAVQVPHLDELPGVARIRRAADRGVFVCACTRVPSLTRDPSSTRVLSLTRVCAGEGPGYRQRAGGAAALREAEDLHDRDGQLEHHPEAHRLQQLPAQTQEQI